MNLSLVKVDFMHFEIYFLFFFSEEKEKMSSVVKKEPLEGTIFFFFERNHNSFHHCRAKYMFEFFDRSENIFQFKLYFFSTDSKLTQLDFSIPKAPVSVQVQSGFRKVEPSSKRKELSTDEIDSKDQCATQ